MNTKHFLSMGDVTVDETIRLIRTAIAFKTRGHQKLLAGKTLAMLFQKPSLRTRVSFDVAMYQLGGHAIDLQQAEVGVGVREPPRDMVRVLSRFADAIMARVNEHSLLEELSKYATVPVINGLSDLEHPCQALADLMTIYEIKGQIKDVSIAYVGDGNNCAASLAMGAVALGADVRIASPKGYWLSPEIRAKISLRLQNGAGRFQCSDDPRKTVRGADVVYTDVWASMGQEGTIQERRRAFAGYQVNTSLLDMAKRDVIFMHPLPAHYGDEVSYGLTEDRRSVVYQQAENRLHAQKSLLVHLLGESKPGNEQKQRGSRASAG